VSDKEPLLAAHAISVFLRARRACALYLVGPSWQGPTKIGISAQMRTRLQELQVGNEKELRIFNAFSVPERQLATHLEARVHEQLAPASIRGEWFRVAPRFCERFIEEAAKSLSIQIEPLEHLLRGRVS
jgi:hypothetical protein